MEETTLGQRKGNGMKLATCVIVACLTASSSFAHGGGLDRNGCHTNKKTGEYHCHGAPPAAPAPVLTPLPSTSRSAPQSLTSQGSIVVKSDQVKSAQLLLHQLGNAVPLDGELDEATLAAIRSFEVSRRLPATGRVTNALVLKLVEAVLAQRCRQ